MLAARSVGFGHRNVPILQEVSLQLEPGRLTALIGPNGAGKSTLLHLLSGALAPDQGCITLDGTPLTAWSRLQLARRRAVLPQISELSFPFRSLEVVLMGRSAYHGACTARRNVEIAASALQQVDAAHLADRTYTTLSGGERQRVQLARALAQIWPDRDTDRPRYLLLDEPTNNLDLAHQHRLLATVHGLTRQGVGGLAVLHDPNLAGLYADRIVLLVNGSVQADGPPDTVLTPEGMAHAFGLEVMVQAHPTRDRPQIVPV